jgi:hypothetical protein
MNRLTKKDFLKKRTPKTEDVNVPEWGGVVTVQEMTAAQRDEFDEFVLATREEGKMKGLRAVVVSICAVDEEGKRLFTNLDVPDLQKQSSKVIGRIADAAMKLSGLSEDDVEEIAKNSEAVTEDGTNSDSANG